MIKKINTKGFTLVELMISMSIFVVFTGIMLNSYTNIVRAQREANEYRQIYVEAREVFALITDEVRNNAIQYSIVDPYNAEIDELVLVAKEGDGRVKFTYVEDEMKVEYSKDFVDAVDGLQTESYFLNSDDVRVVDLKFFVSPLKDPYENRNAIYDSLQFQPKVTVFARFEKDLSGNKTVDMELQTTISSRFYNQSPRAQL